MPTQNDRSLSHPHFVRRWLAANLTGELLALGATTAMGALVPTMMRLDGPLEMELVASIAMLLTGAIEGALLGTAQAWALSPVSPGIGRRWIAATTVAFTVVWGLGILASFLEPTSPPGTGLLVLAALAGGGLLGSVVGAGQAWVLRGLGGDGRAWLGWSAVGWALALVVTALFSTLVPPGPARVDTFVVAMGGGAATGLVFGAITAGAIWRISETLRPS